MKEDVLRAERKLNWNTTLHLSENPAHDRPIHRILQPCAHLLDVMLCQRCRDTESFVEVWSADVEFGDFVAAAEHGVCYGYRRGEGWVCECV